MRHKPATTATTTERPTPSEMQFPPTTPADAPRRSPCGDTGKRRDSYAAASGSASAATSAPEYSGSRCSPLLAGEKIVVMPSSHLIS